MMKKTTSKFMSSVCALTLCASTLIGAEAAASDTSSAGMVKRDYDWCTVETPEKCPPGEEFNVIVTLKNDIPAGMKIGGDLHFATADTYQGFAVWGGTPKAAKAGDSITYTYKMPAKITEKGEGVGIQPIYYLSTKGWNEAAKKAPSAVVLPGADANASATVNTINTDWCTIVAPKTCAPGESFTIKVTLKNNIPAGLKLAGDLHKMNKGGSGSAGYLAWGGNPKAATAGETYEFTYKMPASATQTNGCGPIYYLSAAGWNEAVKRANCKPVLAP